jgi:GTP cyclohydrolase IA
MTSKIIQGPGFKQEDRPSRDEAERAVEILLSYIGENPKREGLIETPARVVRAYEEFFAGYHLRAEDELARTFEEISDFNDIVAVRNIDFVSHCEHHMVAITGKAHVAYWPNGKVVGLSKLARTVDIFARRLVSQESMTRQIADAIDKALSPQGVAVMIEADHQCMSIRGVCKTGSSTVTATFSGIFKECVSTRDRFLKMIGK